VVEGIQECAGAGLVQQVGRVEAIGQGEAFGSVASGGQEPVRAFGGGLPGCVGVGADDGAGLAGAEVGA
jgi:hypothetical protein